MIIQHTAEDEYRWKRVFRYRKSCDDFTIEQKSSKYPENNQIVILDVEDAEMFVEFFKRIKQPTKVK